MNGLLQDVLYGLRMMRKNLAVTALAPTDTGALPLKVRGVYLITGGTGGIGVTLAEWLAARVSARLVLTARRELPPREQWWSSSHLGFRFIY